MMCDEEMGIKINVPERLKVEYKGIKYYPLGYSIYFNRDGSVKHYVTLHDLKANAVVGALLQDVK
jgi:hypothetical protein